jgi:hypothetical protein
MWQNGSPPKNVPVDRSVIILYDCDFLDPQSTSLMRKIWTQRCREKKWRNQTLILFISMNSGEGLLNEIRLKVKHIKLFAKNSNEFRTFYRTVQYRIKNKTTEPLDVRTFPLVAEDNAILNHLCDRRDDRGFLNYLSFLWVTMDGVRVFPYFQNSTQNRTPHPLSERSFENKVALYCFDLVVCCDMPSLRACRRSPNRGRKR